MCTREQRADILIKDLAKVKFAEMRELLGVKNLCELIISLTYQNNNLLQNVPLYHNYNNCWSYNHWHSNQICDICSTQCWNSCWNKLKMLNVSFIEIKC